MSRLHDYEQVCKLNVTVNPERIMAACDRFKQDNPCLSHLTFQMAESTRDVTRFNNQIADNGIPVQVHNRFPYQVNNYYRNLWSRNPIHIADFEFSWHNLSYAVDIVWGIQNGWSYGENQIALKKHPFTMDAINAGAWYLLIGTEKVLVVPVPTLFKLDANIELHCEDGPAVIHLDIQRYYWHGVPVPQNVIEQPDKIKVWDILNETNIEIRRIMIDRYGIDRFMTNADADEIDRRLFRERWYRLYRKFLNREDEPITMLKVTNATAEPDGTFKEYWLRVPPLINDALEAVAWTFALSESDYIRLVFES